MAFKCCFCTCYNEACEGRSFECLDPSAGREVYECEAPPPAPLPCSADMERTWVVNSTRQAVDLAEAVNCSGGSFEVEWRGHVLVQVPIYVADGTVLTITGFNSSAVMQGNTYTRIFTVVNATLHVSGVNITSATSISGGAIAAASEAHVVLNRTNLIGNSASGGNGGAVYLSDRSSLSCVGGAVFAENVATVDGGALFATGRSVVSCGASWFRNVADKKGGAFAMSDGSSFSSSDVAEHAHNYARSFGGVVHATNSSMQWHASTSFYSNYDSFGVAGGAIYATSHSSVLWSGPMLFDSNSASLFGGAVAVVDRSSVVWSGATTFVDNGIDGYFVGDENKNEGVGGALYVGNSSTAFWSAPTTFVGNGHEDMTAGGALFLTLSSSVSWTGNTTFRNNSASRAGGAVAAWQSSLSWSGVTTMSNNVATFNGGALAADESIVFWNSSKTVFFNNSVSSIGLLGEGGAVAVFSSDVSWGEGATEFVGNSAAMRGGALYMASSSNVSWTGDTLFESNEALYDNGGALATADLSSGISYAESNLHINGTTTFSNNTAERGGALSILGECGLNVDAGGEVGFIGNSATFEGGAMFLSNAFIGPRFTFVTFASNSADVGGAVSVSSSGTSQNIIGNKAYPTTFDRCQFIGNQAALTGGAVSSTSGVDTFDDSVFEENVAGTGGALRLTGSASVNNCSFVNNTSDEGQGAAVSSIGVFAARVSNTIFSGNKFNCPRGTFVDEESLLVSNGTVSRGILRQSRACTRFHQIGS